MIKVNRIEYLLVWIESFGSSSIIANHLKRDTCLQSCKNTLLRLQLNNKINLAGVNKLRKALNSMNYNDRCSSILYLLYVTQDLYQMLIIKG